jgi:hypothetical protein
MRRSGNREAYRRAYAAYYSALGRALGYRRDSVTGYWVGPDGRFPGCNDMEGTLGETVDGTGREKG